MFQTLSWLKLTIVTPNEQHTYLCSHYAADRTTWRVNDGVLGLEILTIPGIEYTDSISHPMDAIYTLTIRALPQHNEITIQCTVAFHNGSFQCLPTVTFLIQGYYMSLISIHFDSKHVLYLLEDSYKVSVILTGTVVSFFRYLPFLWTWLMLI